MKSLVLATTVAAGLLFTSGTADAQFRNRYSNYSYPSNSYPGTSYYNGNSTYYGNSYAPSYYSGGVVTSGYTPTYYNGGVVTSGYTPSPTTVATDVAGSYLNRVLPGSYTPSYAYPSNYGGYSSYGGYTPTYSGGSSRGMFGRRR